jgi:hypothetical protein
MMSEPKPRDFSELSDSGLLWLINRAVLHPRGFALGIVYDKDRKAEDRKAIGWELCGDGSEPWAYVSAEAEDKLFAAAEATLAANRIPKP